jgi:hypothetical protein
MNEFNAQPEMKCVVMLVSGKLVMDDCTLSLDGIGKDIAEKVPCLVALEDSTIIVTSCNFKGDSDHEIMTTGILCISPLRVNISHSVITFHKGGGIMMILSPESIVEICENQIYQCETAGIYIEGEDTNPLIRTNKIKFCVCPAVHLYLRVDGDVINNVMSNNDIGVELKNNHSTVKTN